MSAEKKIAIQKGNSCQNKKECRYLHRYEPYCMFFNKHLEKKLNSKKRKIMKCQDCLDRTKTEPMYE